jgi:DNA polymerase-3 subunit beta
MKLTISRANLVALLATCTPIAKAKTTRPELSCVLVEQGQGVLTVSATDLYQSVVARASSESTDKGAVCVNAKDLTSRVATFPEGPITLALVEDKLHLSAGKRKHRLPTIPVDDFPKLDSHELATGWKLDAAQFRSLLERVRPAAREDQHTSLHSVCLTTKGDTLTAAATDGHHLHIATYENAGRLAAPLVVPLPAVDAVLALLAKASGEMMIGLTGNRFTVRLGDTVFSSALVDAKYPPVEDLLAAQKATLSIQAPRDALIDALRSVSLATADGALAGLVVVGIDGDEMTLTGEGKGAASDAVPLDAPAEAPFRFAIMAPLLLQALSPLAPSSSATIHLGPDPISPVRLSSATLPGYLAVVMPCNT